MNILIVEDENIIRNGLVHIISNLPMKFNNILEASNGIEALEIIQNNQVDIVISDIKMPKMSGLDFIKQSYLTYPEIEFIILSGFSDFEFAQQAIRYGVKEYLLKPIDKNILKETLLKIIASIEEKNEVKIKRTKEFSRYTDFQNQLLWNIVKNNGNQEMMKKQLEQFNLSFLHSHFCVIAIKNITEEGEHFTASPFGCFLTENNHIFLSSMTKYHYHYYLVNIDSPAWIHQLSLLSNQKKSPFYIGLSTLSLDISLLPKLITEARFALDNRLIHTKQTVFHAEDYQSTTELKKRPAQEKLKQELLLSAAKKQLNLLTEYYELMINTHPTISIEFLFSLCLEIQQFKTKAVRKQNKNLSLISQSALHHHLSSADEIDEFLAFFIKNLQRLDREIKTISKQADPISTVINYIENNYQEDITLNDLATMVAMNPSYFSTQFRKQTGSTFSHYLQELRINKAISLLQDPNIKIIEVANSVGFHDEKYFFKVFKKITGQTPRKKE